MQEYDTDVRQARGPGSGAMLGSISNNAATKRPIILDVLLNDVHEINKGLAVEINQLGDIANRAGLPHNVECTASGSSPCADSNPGMLPQIADVIVAIRLKLNDLADLRRRLENLA